MRHWGDWGDVSATSPKLAGDQGDYRRRREDVAATEETSRRLRSDVPATSGRICCHLVRRRRGDGESASHLLVSLFAATAATDQLLQSRRPIVGKHCKHYLQTPTSLFQQIIPTSEITQKTYKRCTNTQTHKLYK